MEALPFQVGVASTVPLVFFPESRQAGGESALQSRSLLWFPGHASKGGHPTDIRLSRLQGGYTIPVQTFV